MCPPAFFDAHFLFNPHMDFRERIDRGRATAQWLRLLHVLEEAGAEVKLLEPRPGIGPLVFTADGAFCHRPGEALILRNDGVRGDVEPEIFRGWFEAAGYRTESIPPNHRLDGGNLVRLPDGDVLAGLKPGSSGLAERYLGRVLALTSGAKVATVPLVDERFLHLDTTIGALGPGRFLVYRGGLRDGLPHELSDAEIVDVSAEDAAHFACNVVVVGDVVVTGPVSDGLARRIGRLGYEVARVDLSEFYKAGGGAKCLTLPLLPATDLEDEGGNDERTAEQRSRAAVAR
jgi:N-dimethylarginine dimethylaminohydrolase